jgi:uncharacterized membrane protein YhaH (DUF805 family)
MESRIKRAVAVACNFNGNCKMSRLDYILFTVMWAIVDAVIVFLVALTGVYPLETASPFIYAIPILPAYIAPYWCVIMGRIRDCNFPKWASEGVDSDDWKKWAGPVILFNILDRMYISSILAILIPSRKDEGGRNEALEPNYKAVAVLLVVGTFIYMCVT